MNKIFIKDSLLYYSLKDVLYNEDIIYIYLNDIIENIDGVLNEMLNMNIINKNGIRIPFNKIEWNSIENFFMLNTIEISVALKFIKDNFLNVKETKVVINTNNIKEVIDMLESYFNVEDNITFYFKDNDTGA